jgi:hypothetical protein
MNEEHRNIYNKMSLFQKVKNTCVSLYYISPLGWLFHYDTYLNYWSKLKAINSSFNVE